MNSLRIIFSLVFGLFVIGCGGKVEESVNTDKQPPPLVMVIDDSGVDSGLEDAGNDASPLPPPDEVACENACLPLMITSCADMKVDQNYRGCVNDCKLGLRYECPTAFSGCSYVGCQANQEVPVDKQCKYECDNLFSRDCSDNTPFTGYDACMSDCEFGDKADCADAFENCAYKGCHN